MCLSVGPTSEIESDVASDLHTQKLYLGVFVFYLQSTVWCHEFIALRVGWWVLFLKWAWCCVCLYWRVGGNDSMSLWKWQRTFVCGVNWEIPLFDYGRLLMIKESFDKERNIWMAVLRSTREGCWVLRGWGVSNCQHLLASHLGSLRSRSRWLFTVVGVGIWVFSSSWAVY